MQLLSKTHRLLALLAYAFVAWRAFTGCCCGQQFKACAAVRR